MKEKTASITAEDVAGNRALEMLRPENERVCNDPYAVHFLNERWKKLYKSSWRRFFFRVTGYFFLPGATNAVVARVRFIDEYIKICVNKGLEQLVILGAGYDCRAYRMPELETDIIVFDVDHPATQKEKVDKLTSISKTLPNHVVFVPYQFEKQGFQEKLIEMGYDTKKKSLFIMEGLIMYLEKEVIEDLLSFISNNSGPESSIVFDFLPSGIENGTAKGKGGNFFHKWAKSKGEPFQFGINQEELPQFLQKNGFNNVKSISAEECRNIYFHGASKNRILSELFFFAQATVSSK